MKSTAERLSESYCRPNEIDWKAIELIDDERVIRHYRDWSICATVGSLLGRTEIPVSHFIDLLNDSIAPWRLEEDGFQTMSGIVHTLELRPVIDGETVARRITVITDTGKVYLNDGPTNVTTYTQLLKLIELIG
jgi:hypothetical protein